MNPENWHCHARHNVDRAENPQCCGCQRCGRGEKDSYAEDNAAARRNVERIGGLKDSSEADDHFGVSDANRTKSGDQNA